MDIQVMLASLEVHEKRSLESRGAKKTMRLDEDAEIIEKMLDARDSIATNSFIAVFQDCFGTSKEAAKTRVSAALRKLVAENRVKRLKQGLYARLLDV
jgi:hypothetical protein